MASLYLSYVDEDCGAYAVMLGKRLAAIYPSYALLWPMPPLGNTSERIPVLRQVRQMVIFIGPAWEHLLNAARMRRIDDPHDSMAYDVQFALRQGASIVTVLVERPALPPMNALPPALRGLHQTTTMQCHRADDPGLCAVRLHMKLSRQAQAVY